MRRLLALGLALGLVLPLAPGAGAVAEAVRIVWDRQGVPHVYAETSEGVAFGFGYATAIDRSAQIEIYRRAATGTLSELIPNRVGADVRMRRDIGGADVMAAKLADLPAEIQAMFHAYAKGVNLGWRRVGFEATRPWTATDSVAVAHLTLIPQNQGGSQDLARLGVREALRERLSSGALSRARPDLDPALEAAWRAADAFKPAGPDEPVTLSRAEDLGDPAKYQQPIYPPDYPAAEDDDGEDAGVEDAGTRERPERSPYAGNPDGPLAALAAYGARLPTADEILAVAAEELAFEEFIRSLAPPGSQIWSVSPERSATGNAANYYGGSTGHDAPPRLYQAHLKGGDLDVAGITLPGTPGMGLARNRYGAWGLTDTFADQEDVYVEILCEGHGTSATYGYLHHGECKPMIERDEVFGPPGNQVTRTLRHTVHGPVISIHPAEGIAFAFARLPGEDIAPGIPNEHHDFIWFLELMRARTAEDFRYAVSRLINGRNFAWAGADGSIAYQVSGGQPIREVDPGVEPWDGQYPVPGTGQWDWRGTLAPEEKPAVVDPAAGYLVNTNNRPAPGWRLKYHANNFTGAHDRFPVADAKFAANAAVSASDHMEVVRAYANQHLLSDRAVPLLLEAANGSADPDVALGAEVLAGWGGERTCREPAVPGDPQGGWSCPGREVLDRALSQIRTRVMQNHFAGLAGEVTPNAVMFLAMEGRTAIDYLGGDRNAIIADALGTAVRQARNAFGSDDPEDWSEQKLARPVVYCPIVAGCPGVQGGIPIGLMSEVESATGNTYRQLVLFEEPAAPRDADGGWIIVPGNSEDPASPHFRDNLETFRQWRLNPLWFDDDDVLLGAGRAVVLPYLP